MSLVNSNTVLFDTRFPTYLENIVRGFCKYLWITLLSEKKTFFGRYAQLFKNFLRRKNNACNRIWFESENFIHQI